MDQKKVDQAGHSTNSGYRGQHVFLSHSGKQKNFVRQLHKDLKDQSVSCFFDDDPESLPKGEKFPGIIFEGAEKYKVAVLLLSKDFLEAKWPMLELAAFVKPKYITGTNPNLKILPLFFLMSPNALKDIQADNEKWNQWEVDTEEQNEWCRALKKIRATNGVSFKEGDDEVEYRKIIVEEIHCILSELLDRYDIRGMRGRERMCKELTNFIDGVQSNEKGVRVTGLYGIAGQGKTSLGKAFCNLQLAKFQRKVCHLEFSKSDKNGALKRTKLALRYLTFCGQSHLQTLTEEHKEQAKVDLYRRLKGQKVLLVLDNITEENREEVRDYIEVGLGENSCILLSALSGDLLVNHFNVKRDSCMRVPRLEEDDAIGILLGSTSAEVSTLGPEEIFLALKCANRCSFSVDGDREGRTFHPSALKAFGSQLSKHGQNLSKLAAKVDGAEDTSENGLEGVLSVLREAFDDMLPMYRTIFMLLTVYLLPDMPPQEVTYWLAIICNVEISSFEKAVEGLRNKAFIEQFEPEIRIHNLYTEFAESTANKMERWLWWKDDKRSTRGSYSEDQAGFELVKFEQCMSRSPSQIKLKI